MTDLYKNKDDFPCVRGAACQVKGCPKYHEGRVRVPVQCQCGQTHKDEAETKRCLSCGISQAVALLEGKSCHLSVSGAHRYEEVFLSASSSLDHGNQKES